MPAFIAVRLALRSADGATYGLSVAGRTLTASGSRRASVQLDGLPPGRSHVARAVQGASGSVRIVASAEPGP